MGHVQGEVTRAPGAALMGRVFYGLALLLMLAFVVLLLARDGTGCRPPPDDDPEPACEPGDNTCKAGAPAPSSDPLAPEVTM